MNIKSKQILSLLGTTILASVVHAEEVAAAASSNNKGMIALGAAIAIGVAALGGALGQAKASSSALEGIARNPAAKGEIFTPMIIGLALIESLVIYAFVISILLLTVFN